MKFINGLYIVNREKLDSLYFLMSYIIMCFLLSYLSYALSVSLLSILKILFILLNIFKSGFSLCLALFPLLYDFTTIGYNSYLTLNILKSSNSFLSRQSKYTSNSFRVLHAEIIAGCKFFSHHFCCYCYCINKTIILPFSS